MTALDGEQVGPDLVRIEDGVLMIYSKRDMSEWVVDYCRPPAGYGNEVASPGLGT